MKKIISYFFITLALLFAHVSFAQAIDVGSLSEAQKRAALNSLSASDRSRIAKELGVNASESQQPLSEPVVVMPKVIEPSVTNPESEELKDALSKTNGLKRFGYDLFAGVPSTFAPATDIPVPQNYILGPGDNVIVTFFGSENDSFPLVVSREGVLNIPGLEPIVATNMSFERLSQEVEDRVRSMRIFVLGEANQPGAFTVSSLSTMINALFVSGGVKKIGSLRNIQLKRKGRVVKTLDLYSLLLKGDTSNDAELEPGDVIFIPTVGELISVAGAVNRPAIYEIKKEHHLKDMIAHFILVCVLVI